VVLARAAELHVPALSGDELYAQWRAEHAAKDAVKASESAQEAQEAVDWTAPAAAVFAMAEAPEPEPGPVSPKAWLSQKSRRQLGWMGQSESPFGSDYV
jgi:hypothetical protein